MNHFLITCTILVVGLGCDKDAPASKDKGAPQAKVVSSDTDSELLWGTLRGRIMFSGAIPEPAVIVPLGAVAKGCPEEGILNEGILVDPLTKGLANVFVYVRRASRVHKTVVETQSQEVTLLPRGCRFIPYAKIVGINQPILIRSEDPVRHHLFFLDTYVPSRSPVFPGSPKLPYIKTFTKTETKPIWILCHSHPWERAWILVLDHGYGTVTTDSGEFLLEQLPVGDLTLDIWHESLGFIRQGLTVTVDEGSTNTLEDIEVLPDDAANNEPAAASGSAGSP